MSDRILKFQKVLASTYVLYLKAQNYHWNVEGENFYSLHKLFEEQYNDLALAADEIAERIRFLGEKAVGTYKEYLDLSVIDEGDNKLKASDMVKDLSNDQSKITKLLREVANDFEDDDATNDLMVGRISIHEKNEWMLRTIVK